MFWLAAGCVLLLAIMYLALIPIPNVMPSVTWSDKIIHCVVFGGLMVWFAALFPPSFDARVFATLLVYGLIMELLQSLAPNRLAEFGDIVADAAGLLVGVLLVKTSLRRWPLWLEKLAGSQ